MILKTCSAALAAATLWPSLALAQYAALPPDLAAAATAYDKAQVDGDGAALQRLLADDYRLVNGAGQVETKAQFIADSVAPGGKLPPFVVEQPILRVWTDGAVLAGLVHLGGAESKAIHFADVWARRAGRWQVVFTEVTREPKD